MDDPLEGQDRADPTESSTTVDLDLQDEDTKETIEKRKEGDLSVDDIENDELREKVKQARAQAEDETDDGSDDGDVSHVRVEEGQSPLDAVAEDAFGDQEADLGEYDSTEEAKEAYADGEIDDAELDDAIEDGLESEEGGMMDGVEDDDIEEAMDMDLNVVDDVDPEHFDYENQDFSSFSNYGDEVTIEYNNAYFQLVQPSDQKQEELINNMGGGVGGSTSMTEMMEQMINATVARPSNIDEVVADWSPFERMGLGMQCMEFLGLDAMGNM